MPSKSRLGMGRIAIVGVGAVGSTTAYALVQSGVAREIVLVDTDVRRAEGELMDLQHCVPFTSPVRITSAALDEATECDLVIVTAGVAQRPGETRLELVQRNTAIFRTLFPRLSDLNPDAHFLIVTNPVDIMTRVGLTLSGLPPNRLFGSGTVLDTGRFRQLISDHTGVQAQNVHAYVVGEHGDSEVMAWSQSRIGPFLVEQFCERHHIPLGPELKHRIDCDVRRAAYQIIERKGATHFAIGLACVRLVEAMRHQSHALFTLSRRLGQVYDLGDVCLSVPTLLGRNGAERQIELDLNEEEMAGLIASAKVLDSVYHEAMGAG